MPNYLGVVKAKGASHAAKVSFACEGIAAAIQRMCELLRVPLDDVEEYDLMEMDGATLRVVASRFAKPASVTPLHPKPQPANVSMAPNEYQSFITETI